MRTLKTISALILMLLAYNVSATKYIFKAMDNKVETKLCVATGNNDTNKLKRIIRMSDGRQNYSVKLVANTVLCNDMVISHFADKYGANDTFLYFNRVTYKRNKLPQTTVTIRDIAMVESKDEEIKIISIGGF